MSKVALIYDNYGIYPNEIVDDAFLMNDYLYKLELVKNVDEGKASLYAEFLEKQFMKYHNFYGKLLKNRDGNFLTHSQSGDYILAYYKLTNVTYNDALEFNLANIINESNYNLNEMKEIWIERLENIQGSCFNSLSNEDSNYNEVFLAVSFAFGISESAISYLVDVIEDYGENIERLTLTHVRLNSLDSYTFLNPLNIIVDSVVRDFAELYKYEIIDLSELKLFIEKMNLTIKEASLLMARVLYPTRIFDLIEENYLCDNYKFSNALEYLKCLDKDLQRIKNLHCYLIKKYNIRPIEWLIKNH